MSKTNTQVSSAEFKELKTSLLDDYKIAVLSRKSSVLGRKEVLTGKAKFGIFGDGKELPQLALSKIFKNGDFRSGYYRDQTLMMAIDQFDTYSMFVGMYAYVDLEKEPHSGGRQMVGHFATHLVDAQGEWKSHLDQPNTSSDISCTAGQMPRLLGLAYASKFYAENKLPDDFKKFSNKGREIAIGTIGNASTSEGHFFEILNAAGVEQVPMVMSVWDDAYGISVHNSVQTIKESISKVMKGFQKKDNSNGIEIMTVRGWNYPELLDTYVKAEKIARINRVPVLVHVTELTQPLGHSTSGSHERYKSQRRLNWEKEYDCLTQFRKWLTETTYTVNDEHLAIATDDELNQIDVAVEKFVIAEKKRAWADYVKFMNDDRSEMIDLSGDLVQKVDPAHKARLEGLLENLIRKEFSYRRDILHYVKEVLRHSRHIPQDEDRQKLLNWHNFQIKLNKDRYNSHIYSQAKGYQTLEQVAPQITDELKDGRVILRDNFEALLEKYPEMSLFGEDVGKIGDVNQGAEGLQEKFGNKRVFDTGIRELSIVGMGIGMAMRGLRPIAEIQYLDYILYGLQTLSDDLASLHYRTKGTQKAPLIIRTRGHRLEGVWHSGSPMSAVLNLTRGMYVLTPRNMTQAAGMYNALMKMDNPAILVECLNAYRKKEKAPANLGEFTVPIGEVETLREGQDITLVTYGACCPIALEAAELLKTANIDVEVIDVQSLNPFDTTNEILKSLEKTNNIAFLDEDVPGGTTSYMLDEVLVKRHGYDLLESRPITISAQEHRPAYSSDGDYFSKPNVDTVFDTIYTHFSMANPAQFPPLY